MPLKSRASSNATEKPIASEKEFAEKMRELYVPLCCYKKMNRQEKEMSEDSLTAILEAMPREVYQPSTGAAVFELLQTLLLVAVSITIFTTMPWYMTPLGWIITACAMVSIFNVGHDCAHKTFTDSPRFNNIVGEIAFVIFMHPFQAFKFKHLHAQDFMRKVDSAPRIIPAAAVPHSLLATLGLQGFFKEHYQISSFPAQFRSAVRRSVIWNVIAQFMFFSALIYYHGPLGPVIYWLVPLIIYKDLLFPMWLDYARMGMNVHFPKRISASIPSYNLRLASQCIEEWLSRTNPQAEKVVEDLHQQARRQKEGDKAEGNDHVYGSEESARKWDTWQDVSKNINWINVVILFGIPCIALYGVCTTQLHQKTAVLSVIWYFYTALGITAGYHRLWAHRAYEASPIVEYLLMLGGTGALEGSIKWWCGGHRVHHRYTDTPKDPYNAKFGFWYSHMGWMLVKPEPKFAVKADIRDLKKKWFVNFQHKHFAWLGPFMSLVAPTLIAGLGWGDWRGGYFYAGALRQVVIHHSTFCVNSLAHMLGEHTFDDERSPRDHFITALITCGEGYHNFHHEFPNDYRNAIKFYQYDPTKWFIKLLSIIGLTYSLKEFPANEVMKGRILMQQKALDREKAKLMYPGPTLALPAWNWETIRRKVREGVALVVFDDLVHDVSNFVDDHPGGRFLKDAIGRDCTKGFLGQNGPLYKHSTAAHHLLTTFRVARLVDDVPSSSPEKEYVASRSVSTS
eukprot:gb/GEZN01002088.1/.p1 GENE.gb/GEZN01002088.1/~~gb/GEZN01002088.1/.p1  ORF type:complete len:737 (-),score=103.98 gb/GEZN01002088.1/:347-2557(-)